MSVELEQKLSSTKLISTAFPEALPSARATKSIELVAPPLYSH
jgi:hypothetical protein